MLSGVSLSPIKTRSVRGAAVGIATDRFRLSHAADKSGYAAGSQHAARSLTPTTGVLPPTPVVGALPPMTPVSLFSPTAAHGRAPSRYAVEHDAAASLQALVG